MPHDIEQPACFYLGREYDLAKREVQADKPIMYDARDLLTHGVVVGMTGSGKTGLCISLLEEAAIDGIPCIVIDPKGDLTNLLLQFPDLDPKDFLPWIAPEDVRSKGTTPETYATQLAERWRQGLAESGQPIERIRRLKEASDWSIYTPGSEAGLPLSVLQTFSAPPPSTPRELLNQKIDATAAALLGLSGVDADPVQSREHILIAQILLHSWSKGKSLDLAQLISQVQTPPMGRIGTFDVETFYPEKDRLKLAIALNNLLASPSFSTWLEGEPLDLTKLLAGKGGKPRQAIFYVAHLDDSQRMFFITLLLEEVLSWTRKQSGTTDLRAILYFDEVFGYLPPHPANPPTKQPLMTLLKQARAFGVGILLATQNPVDLDYKALSNAGTWFVGKLQTERDKARLIEGLQGVAAERGTLNDRGHLEQVISALGNRVFLLHDVHRPQPILFQTRFALSFLRGPMTRDQVAQLMEPQKHAAEPTPTSAAGDDPKQQDQEFRAALRPKASMAGGAPLNHVPPGLPADVVQYYLPVVGSPPTSGTPLLYQPRLLACADVLFIDKKRGQEHRRSYQKLLAPPNPGQALLWPSAEDAPPTTADSAHDDATWADVAEDWNTGRKLKALQKAFAEFLYNNARIAITENKKLDLISTMGEDAAAFRLRCQTEAMRQADAELHDLAERFRPDFEKLQAVAPPPPPPPKEPTWLERMLPKFMQPETIVIGPVGGVKKADVERRRKLEAQYEAKKLAINEKWKTIAEGITDVQLAPRKSDIAVQRFGLAWTPFWRLPSGELRAAYRP
ncbi:MAG: DUF87 domain-containing protein [Gemmataceae bacterium]